MAFVTLLHPEETFTIPVLQAINKCRLFQNNLSLAAAPYRVQSRVSLSIFRDFLSALEGNAIEITDTNFIGLKRLCEEFVFSELGAKLSEFRPSMDFKEPKTETEDADTRERIATLEEQTNQHSHVIEVLEDKVTQLSTDFGRLVGEVSALRSVASGIQTLSGEISALQTQIGQKMNDVIVEQLSTELIELRKEILTLKTQTSAMSLTVTPSQNQPPSPSPVSLPPSQQPPVRSVPLFDSRIISDFPEIFAEFRTKQFSLLWRGSRDGFSASEFHGRCDGHANTLTVILDTNGNIFGGFTPAEWESRVRKTKLPVTYSFFAKPDNSEKSFLFTLKNPHNITARFALNALLKGQSIGCNSQCGPIFGSANHDIYISDNCNANASNWTFLGGKSEVYGTYVFTGSAAFQVEEIEVFEVKD
jgi:archaellum component FlaC